MLILALDTSSRTGSIALARDDELLDVQAGDASVPHGRRLPGDLLRLVERQGVLMRDVDLYAVVAGPGSFTGLRVGIATVQGLAFAHRRPVVAVSALAAWASAAAPLVGAAAGEPLVAALIDAERGELYSALYRRVSGGDAASPRASDRAAGIIEIPPGFDERLDPLVASPEATAARLEAARGPASLLLAGDGLIRHRARLVERLGPGVRTLDDPAPLAPIVARVAAAAARGGRTIPPHGIRPVYVRRPDAELARERRAETPQPGGRIRIPDPQAER